MGNRKILILSGTLAALVVAALLYATHENDPVFEGKRLSAHLETIRANGFNFYGTKMPPEPKVVFECTEESALAAISKVGTNALPMLTRMLRSKDSRFGLWMRSMTSKSPRLGKLVHLKPPQAYARQIQAVVAFQRLGPQAASAIPKIVPLLDDPELAMPALFAVMYIRPEREQDFLSLTNVLRVQTPSQSGVSAGLLHSLAILALSQFGARASGAVPLLLDNLTKTNEQVRAASAVALARIGAAPGNVVPLILKHLPKTNPPPFNPATPGSMWSLRRDEIDRDLCMNIWALSEYSHHASNALPILSNLLRYPDSSVRNAAAAAAAKIRGETNSVSR